MEQLSKKTTILFSPDLHERLTRLAEQRGTSLGDLVRAACEKQYGLFSVDDRLGALRELTDLELPVADPGSLKRESIPDEQDLMP